MAHQGLAPVNKSARRPTATRPLALIGYLQAYPDVAAKVKAAQGSNT
jgi:hypothetical protein